MDHKHYDTVVIGSGPGGEGAAMKLVKSGQRVALIERHKQVGGGCIHRGTIPSKALRHSIQMLTDLRCNPLFQEMVNHNSIDYPQLLASAGAVIEKQVETRNLYYRRNQVAVYHGQARFTGTDSVMVDSGRKQVGLSADHFVIATGSRPYRPADIDFDHPRILDSDTVLSLNNTPGSMTIYGAGVIGCEYASVFSHIDVKVNLVNTRDHLLSFLDDEITTALSYHLREQGTIIRDNEEYERVEPGDDGVVLHCKSGKKLKSDVLLFANGRTGNTDDMGLAELGIEINRRGQIEINASYQTAVPTIHAVGDVVGFPGLASASYDQGRFVGELITDGQCDWHLPAHFPTGIYTTPEISSVGATERELTERQVPFEIGRAMFNQIARAQITGHTTGMLKLLFHRDTLEILGIHCFGEQASEIVHIGQAIMHQPGEANTLHYFTRTTFNYPTMAEAYRVAALDGLNRLF